MKLTLILVGCILAVSCQQELIPWAYNQHALFHQVTKIQLNPQQIQSILMTYSIRNTPRFDISILWHSNDRCR